MNLRDKLNAIKKTPKPAEQKTEEPKFTDCWHTMHVHPLDEFPGAFEIDRQSVMLMQQEDMPEDFDPRRILFLDTETTGFVGTGTVAFMLGLGWLTEDGFEVHQYVLRDYPEEPFQLQRLDETLARFDMLCSFNGRTFDIPLLRQRYLMNRMKPTLLDKPHIDLLHIARRVFKLRLKQCNLGHLEEAILGVPRLGDLPGSEAPQRFFNYLKTGQFSLLYEVLEHNEQDIASLCTLLAHMCRVYRQPEQLSFTEDVYAMGVALERMHHPEEARRCYRLVSNGKLHAQSQLHLAASYRRGGDRSTARDVWRQMIARKEGGITPYIELAKYYEHVERNLPLAMELAQHALSMLSEPSLLEPEETSKQREALMTRYQRLKTKLDK